MWFSVFLQRFGGNKDPESKEIARTAPQNVLVSRGHHPMKQGFWGKLHQKVHPKVRVNLCQTSSLWHLFWWSPGSAERIWADLFFVVQKTFGKIAHRFSANSFGKFVRECFGLVTPGSGPSKNSPPKLTPKIVGIPSTHRFLRFFISPRFCCLWGDQFLSLSGVCDLKSIEHLTEEDRHQVLGIQRPRPVGIWW